MPYSPQDITVSDLLGRPPSWLLRSGIGLIFVVVLIGLSLAAFIRYPDQLSGSLEVYYEQPPVALSPSASTPIAQLLVKHGDSVQRGQALVLFQSDTRWEEVVRIENIVENITQAAPPPKIYRLGTLQRFWSDWVDAHDAVRHFEQHNGLRTQLENLGREQAYVHELIDILSERLETSARQLQLETGDYERQRQLAGEGVISILELENKEKAWLGLQNQHRSQEAERVQLELRTNSLAQQTTAAKLSYENTAFKLQQSLAQARARLRGAIRNWRNQFLLVAPVAGQVQLPGTISVGQSVQPGSPVLTILPNLHTNTQLTARICLPPAGSGKVSLGDPIILRLDAWPAAEYGTLASQVAEIAPLPESKGEEPNCNLVMASLPRALRTDYGKTLTPLPHMTGEATIITAERSLLGRIFEQFRKLIQATNT